MATVLENLTTSRENIASQIATETAACTMKPERLKELMGLLKSLDEQIAAAQSPVEVESIGVI